MLVRALCHVRYLAALPARPPATICSLPFAHQPAKTIRLCVWFLHVRACKKMTEGPRSTSAGAWRRSSKWLLSDWRATLGEERDFIYNSRAGRLYVKWQHSAPFNEPYWLMLSVARPPEAARLLASPNNGADQNGERSAFRRSSPPPPPPSPRSPLRAADEVTWSRKRLKNSAPQRGGQTKVGR